MMKRADLPSSVLERRAIVYVRQSTLIQVEENLEGQRRQNELADRARERGFRDIVVIDDDLGISASGTSARTRCTRARTCTVDRSIARRSSMDAL